MRCATSSKVAFATALLFMSVASPNIANAEPNYEIDSPAPMTAAEQHASEIRQMFGLNSNVQHILAVEADSTSTSTSLGIPLTGEEKTKIDRQIGLTQNLKSMATALPDASSYGGLWIDQAAGGVVHVGVTTEMPTSRRSNLVSAAGATTAVQFTQVPYSLAELQRAHNAVTTLMTSNVDYKRAVTASMVMPQSGEVQVTVKPGTPAELESVLRGISPAVKLVESRLTFNSQAQTTPSASAAGSTRDVNAGPLYGGQWTGGCTVGYSNMDAGAARPAMITAGHCGSANYYRLNSGTGDFIGSPINNTGPKGGYAASNCDCVTVGPLTSGLVTSGVVTDPSSGPFQYTNTATLEQYAPGTAVCMSGAAYADQNGGGITCGITVASTTSATYADEAQPNGYTLEDASVANYGSSLPGDSGGPVGSGGTFMGIHAAAGALDGMAAGMVVFSKSTNFPTVGATPLY